jgi:hypothetical protein
LPLKTVMLDFSRSLSVWLVKDCRKTQSAQIWTAKLMIRANGRKSTKVDDELVRYHVRGASWETARQNHASFQLYGTHTINTHAQKTFMKTEKHSDIVYTWQAPGDEAWKNMRDGICKTGRNVAGFFSEQKSLMVTVTS